MQRVAGKHRMLPLGLHFHQDAATGVTGRRLDDHVVVKPVLAVDQLSLPRFDNR